MVKRSLVMVMAAVAAILCCACSSVYSGEYYYSEKVEEGYNDVAASGMDIKNYSSLKQAILNMIDSRQESGAFQFSNYRGTVSDDLAAVCLEIKNEMPMGAYAVAELTYDLSRIVSYYTAQVIISYTRSAEEIASVISLTGLAELRSCLDEAARECAELVTIRMYSLVVDAAYISDYIRTSYLEVTSIMALEPQVSINSYPETGASQIYEIKFEYPVANTTALEMTNRLRAAAASLAGNVSGETPAVLSLRIADLLNLSITEAEDAQFGDSAYGAIVDGVASDKGIALAYKALCSLFDIECIVAQGTSADLSAQVHYWNIICIDGYYYHVDLTGFDDRGREDSFLLNDSRMWKYQFWDVERYPQCDGPLSYSDIVSDSGAERPTVITPEPTTEPEPSPSEEPVPSPTEPEPSASAEPTKEPGVPEPENEI